MRLPKRVRTRASSTDKAWTSISMWQGGENMAEWWSIEVFHGDKLPASQWRYTYEDALINAALTHGAVYWDWHDSQYGVLFEVCFPSEEQWEAFRKFPAVLAALDAVPDPVNGLLVYRGRGGAAGSRKPRKPKPAPSAAALELEEPREARRIALDTLFEELGTDPRRWADPNAPDVPGEPARQARRAPAARARRTARPHKNARE
jgi:hypothetical protein